MEPLDGTNYKRWSQRVVFYLEQLEVDYVLFSDPPESVEKLQKFTKDNKTARGHLLSHMTNPIFDLLLNNKSARSVWETLQNKYGKKKYAVENWLKFKMVEDEPIMDQVHLYEYLTAEVIAQGMDMCEVFQANVLINKLPDSLADYRNRLMHKKRDMTLEELTRHMNRYLRQSIHCNSSS